MTSSFCWGALSSRSFCRRLDPKWGNAWVREIFDFSVALLDIPTAVFAAEPATEKQLLDLWFSTLGYVCRFCG